MTGMVSNGIPREDAEKLYHMLEGFADYGFPESHAASFALLAYASAYVKCHEPAIFCRRSSTCSRWASTPPRCWSTTRAATASWCARSR